MVGERVTGGRPRRTPWVRTLKWWHWAAGAAWVVASLAVVIGWKRIQEHQESEEQARLLAAAIEEHKLALRVPLRSLIDVYVDNEVRGAQSYGGKLVRTGGTVRDIRLASGGRVLLTLEPHEGTGRAECNLRPGQEETSVHLSRGTAVQFIGRVAGFSRGAFLHEVFLSECLLLERSP